MVMVLSIIGFFLAVAAWENIHPVVGVIVGILLIGGSGWKMLLGMLSFLRPSARSAYGPQGREFIGAWEAMNGPMRPGVESSKPPVGAFQNWLRANRLSGVSAGEWLRLANRKINYAVPACLSPIIPTLYGGEDTGHLAVFDDGDLVFVGQRINMDIPWASIRQWSKYENVTDAVYCLDLQGIMASIFLLGPVASDHERLMCEVRERVAERKPSVA